MNITDILIYAICIIGILMVLGAIYGSFFSVQTQTVMVIERFGKFNRIARAGLNFKLPFIESKAEVDMATFQIKGELATKTKDNVFVTLPVVCNYAVGNTLDQIVAFHYKLTDVKQIQSYLYNILLGHIPLMDLDDLFTGQQSVSLNAAKELEVKLADFGITIISVMLTNIAPDAGVVAAMNSINEQTRLKVSNAAQGEAEYVLKTKQAEADAKVMEWAGKGVAAERMAIAEGWEKSLETMKASGLDEKQATFLLLFTNWTEMLKTVGSSKNSTMVFMPAGPDSMTNFQQTMTNALLAQTKDSK